MALTTSLYTGLTGLNASTQMLDVTGNNIANVNTTAFKRSRIDFETAISRTLANATSPTEQSGGTNPAQVGLGVQLGSIKKEFTNGTLQTTGSDTDLAIEGDGFFIVENGSGRQYTRNGSFSLDRDYNLVTSDGAIVQGFGVNDDFSIQEDILQPLSIPQGTLTLAEATEQVQFGGNLNAGGDVATLGSIAESAPVFSAPAGPPATAATALTSLFNAAGAPLFSTGDLLSFTGAEKGGATLPDKTFQVGSTAADPDASGSTLGELLDFINQVAGIDTSLAPGATVNASGQVVVAGNIGSANDLVLNSGNLINNADTAPALPFDFTKTQTADGESTRTSFIVFDSLGNEVTVDLRLVLEDKTNSGTDWRFYAQSDDDTDLNSALSTGTLSFDTQGQLLTTSDNTIAIDRDGTGAGSPLSILLNFADDLGSVTALSDVTSEASAVSQDGSPLGTLSDFSIGQDGVITGVFSNGLLRDLGRVTLATFANNHGLEAVGSSMFRPTANSGIAAPHAPGSAGAGRVIGRALETSNVELSQEFVNLITASTGFSANSRVISTSERLIQELMNAIR